MSFFTNIASWFSKEKTIVEADVQKVIAAFIKGEQVALADAQKIGLFVAQEVPTIVNDLADVASFAEAVAPVVPQIAVINAGLQTAKSIVAGLQTYADSVNAITTSGATPSITQLVQSGIAGYNTYNQAVAATAQVAALATKQST